MKSHVTLKMLALIVAAILPIQIVSAKSNSTGAVEEQQVQPHVLHAGLGYSYIASLKSLKSGAGIDVGYEYLFPKSHWSVGVIYTGHYSGGILKTSGGLIELPEGGYELAPPATNIDVFIHNIAPTIGGYWSWGKHGFKASVGAGYINKMVLRDVEHSTMKRSREYDGGMSVYLSLEYEYRPYPDTGIFVRLHDMEHHGKSDDTYWEGIVGYGIATGFNFHF